MNDLHSLLFQKGRYTLSVPRFASDLLEAFGFVCTKMDFPISNKTKDITTTNWKDRDGEDSYIPSIMRIDAFDLKIGVCYSGNIGESESKLQNLIQYLRTDLPIDGSGLMVWSELYKRGFQKCYLKEIVDIEYTYLTHNEVLECTLIFRITDPTTQISIGRVSVDSEIKYTLIPND